MLGENGAIVLDFFLQLDETEMDKILAVLGSTFPSGHERLPALRAREPANPPPPDVQQLLLEKDHVYRPMFRDLQDVQRMKKMYGDFNNKSGKHRTDVNDTSFVSHNWAESVGKVGEIFDALVDLSDIKDKGKMKYDPALNAEVEVKEESTAVRRTINSSNLELQLLSWDIFVSGNCYSGGISYEKKTNWNSYDQLSSEDAQNGRVDIPPWTERWKFERYDSLELRLTKIKQGLKKGTSTTHSLKPLDNQNANLCPRITKPLPMTS